MMRGIPTAEKTMSPALQTAILLALLVAMGCLAVFLVRLIRAQRAAGDLKTELTDLRGEQQRVLEALREGHLKSLEIGQRQFKDLVDTLQNQHRSTQSNFNDHLANTGKTLSRVHEQLGGLEKTAQNLAQLGRDVNKLQDLLKAPKLRGRLGEILLEKMLEQVLPREQYQMQFQFKNGVIVDAVIRLADSMVVPVDSKFPLEAFQRAGEIDDEAERARQLKQFHAAIRKQVSDIAAKYINPAEGTYEFALMYIPSESIYYQTITTDEPGNNLIDFALDHHVVPVSPNTFYVFLMVIAYGLKGLRIEQEAHAIRSQLASLEHAFAGFAESFQTLGRHLGNAQNKYIESDKQLTRFGDHLAGIAGQTDRLAPLPTDTSE